MANGRKTKGDPCIITVACQKGGVGKTTTSIVLSTILANMGYKVLGVDCDQQGNFTETFTGIPVRTLRKEGYLGVVFAVNPNEDPKEFLWDDSVSSIKLPKNFDLLIGDERTGFFSERLDAYDNIPDKNFAIKAMLDKIKSDYDYIIIDTAPALSKMLTNALVASDGVVCMYQPEKYCYSAMFSLFETIEEVSMVNPKLKPLGIVTVLLDGKRKDMHEFIEIIRNDEQLGKYCFNTVIQRRAVTGRLAYAGVNKEDNPEAPLAMRQYIPLVKEVIKRGKKS